MKNTPQRSMNRSKYQNSSKKIKQLYQEFENLKQRISTPIKHKRQPIVSLYQNQRKNYSTQLKAASLSYNNSFPRQQYDLGAKSMIEHETRIFLKNSFEKFIFQNLNSVQKRVDNNVRHMEDRIESFGKILVQVQRLIQLKASNIKSLKNLKCNCKWKGQQIKLVESKWEKKLSELKSSYQTKISLLVKQSNQAETSESSNCKRFPKQAQEQLKILQQKMLIKQGEIIDQQKQVTRLRRINDQKQKLLYQKQNLMSEIMKQNQEKNVEIINFKNTIERLKKQLEQKNIQIDKKDDFQEKIKKQIEDLQQKNYVLETQINKLRKQNLVHSNVNDLSQLRTSRKSKANQWDFSQIQQQQQVHSDFEGEEQIIGNSLKISPQDYLQPLRHSHFIQTNTKKRYFQLQVRVKELESELQLVVQENRLLKSKKDQFEQQVKDNQVDEQKFQMQSQVLRQQIKRLNISIKKLDEAATMTLNGEKLGLNILENLDRSMKFKQTYLKKYPARSSSVKKK